MSLHFSSLLFLTAARSSPPLAPRLDCQSMHEIYKYTLQFKCSSLNALGMASEIVVLLNCDKFSLQFGDEANSPITSIGDVEIDPQNALPKRLDVSYPANIDSKSVGETILSQHEIGRKQKNMVMASLSFASPYLKQRFLGRVRALKKVRLNDEERRTGGAKQWPYTTTAH